MSYQTLLSVLKGGAGSGNFGHAGRIGKRGGSVANAGMSEAQFRQSSAYLLPHTTGYELSTSGGLSGSLFGRFDDFIDTDTRDFLTASSLRTGKNKIKSLVSDAEFAEYERILSNDKLQLDRDTKLYFGISGEHAANLWDEFTSRGARHTGLSADRAANYAVNNGIVVELKARKGQKVVMTDVFDLPEAVFLPGSKIKRTGKSYDKTLVDGRKIKVVEAELVDDGKQFMQGFINYANNLDNQLGM